MQSYRIYFTVAGGNMRPLFIVGGEVYRVLTKKGGSNEENGLFIRFDSIS
jgi:hypothetical protein